MVEAIAQEREPHAEREADEGGDQRVEGRLRSRGLGGEGSEIGHRDPGLRRPHQIAPGVLHERRRVGVRNVSGARGAAILGGDPDQLRLRDRLGAGVVEDVLLRGPVREPVGDELGDVRAADDLLERAREGLARLDLIERLAL